jgi:hypothetical protein
MYLYAVIKTEVVFVTVNFQKENFVSQNRNSDAAFGKIFRISKCFRRTKSASKYTIFSTMKLQK